MKSKFLLLGLGVALLGFLACSTEEQNPEKKQRSQRPVVTLMTHDSFSVSTEVVALFEEKYQARLVILKSGDAGEALNKAILSKNNPLADVFYGVDNTFLSRALKADMFVPYAPLNLEGVDPALRLDPENRLIPVDFGDVCLNYDILWFQEKNLAVPTMLEDLIRPEYRDLTVVQNPATSSPGLAFLLATISRFGPEGYVGYWQKLKANGVEVTNGWKEAYWGKFTAASDGERPIVVSYASSPAAEVFFSKTPLDQAPTGVVTENGAAFRQIEFAGILKGTGRLDLAQKTMDFLLSQEFQQEIPLQMFVFPVNKSVVLPEVFIKHAHMADTPAALDPGLMDEKRDEWIREWTENILQ